MATWGEDCRQYTCVDDGGVAVAVATSAAAHAAGSVADGACAQVGVASSVSGIVVVGLVSAAATTLVTSVATNPQSGYMLERLHTVMVLLRLSIPLREESVRCELLV